MRRCGVAPPPIIFERLQLPQQIIYRRKENLSESPNHQKYWENILVSRFYEQFSRNRRNLGLRARGGVVPFLDGLLWRPRLVSPHLAPCEAQVMTTQGLVTQPLHV